MKLLDRLPYFMRERQQQIPLHAASDWLHRNVPDERVLRDREPHALRLEEGIAVYPDDIGPRLPILGLRALTQNQLLLTIDPERMRVNLRTKDFGTKILRVLGRLL